MELTDENKAEISIIAQKEYKELALNVNKSIESLTEVVKDIRDNAKQERKEIIAEIKEFMTLNLKGIKKDYSAQIALVIQERKNDIKTLENNITILIQGLREEINSIKNDQKTCKLEHKGQIEKLELRVKEMEKDFSESKKEMEKIINNLEESIKKQFGNLPENFISKNEPYKITVKGFGIVLSLIASPLIVGLILWWLTDK